MGDPGSPRKFRSEVWPQIVEDLREHKTMRVVCESAIYLPKKVRNFRESGSLQSSKNERRTGRRHNLSVLARRLQIAMRCKEIADIHEMQGDCRYPWDARRLQIPMRCKKIADTHEMQGDYRYPWYPWDARRLQIPMTFIFMPFCMCRPTINSL